MKKSLIMHMTTRNANSYLHFDNLTNNIGIEQFTTKPSRSKLRIHQSLVKALPTSTCTLMIHHVKFRKTRITSRYDPHACYLSISIQTHQYSKLGVLASDKLRSIPTDKQLSFQDNRCSSIVLKLDLSIVNHYSDQCAFCYACILAP